MPKRILIIDDEPDMVKILEARVKAAGYETLSAVDGEEGLKMVRQTNPDLILLDVMMPKVDGFEVIKALKKDPQYKKVPVIMLTARSAMRDTFDAIGVDDFIPKPFEAPELLAKIDALIKERALLLSDDLFVIGKVKEAFSKYGYDVTAVKNEEELLKFARQARCEYLVVHLPYTYLTPEQFAKVPGLLKFKEPVVIIYSDARVKGTEDNDTIMINEIKVDWLRSGFGIFFDQRIAEGAFADLLKSVRQPEKEKAR